MPRILFLDCSASGSFLVLYRDVCLHMWSQFFVVNLSAFRFSCQLTHHSFVSS